MIACDGKTLCKNRPAGKVGREVGRNLISVGTITKVGRGRSDDATRRSQSSPYSYVVTSVDYDSGASIDATTKAQAARAREGDRPLCGRAVDIAPDDILGSRPIRRTRRGASVERIH